MTAKHRIMALSLVTGLFVAGCGSHPASQFSVPSSSRASHSKAPSTPPAAVDPLTGTTSPAHGPLIAVMVENSQYARPQYGLRSADVVYEAYTENFYYSRFMLLFWGSFPKVLGPVRSARPYFVYWVNSWKAAYFHAGGSTPAYADIAADGIHNVDADYGEFENLFYRTSAPAPHNLFADATTLANYARQTWGSPAVTPQWSFAKQGRGTPQYASITMQWNTQNTIEQWRWDEGQQGWTRWVDCPECGGGYTQVMGMNSSLPVVASNVVIQYTTESLDMADPNAGDRWINVNTQGTGEALLFLGHKYYRGTWENAGNGEPTKFFLPNGQPAKFDPGQTWIEVVPTSTAPSNFKLTLGS